MDSDISGSDSDVYSSEKLDRKSMHEEIPLFDLAQNLAHCWNVHMEHLSSETKNGISLGSTGNELGACVPMTYDI